MIDLLNYHFMIHAIVFSVIIFSVYTDIKYYKILNKVVYPTMGLGILVSFIYNGLLGVKTSMLGIFLISMSMFIFYALKFLGAGDIKLLASIGSFLGAKETFYMTLYSFLGGGIVAVCLLFVRKNGKERMKKLVSYLKLTFLLRKILEYDFDKNDKKSLFRFTYAILIGYLIYLIEANGYVSLFK